jgi:hypothetical protein
MIGTIGTKSWPKAIFQKLTLRHTRHASTDVSSETLLQVQSQAGQAPSLGRRRRVGQVFQQKHAQVTSHAVAVSWTPGA